jgi:DNA repair protein RadC
LAEWRNRRWRTDPAARISGDFFPARHVHLRARVSANKIISVKAALDLRERALHTGVETLGDVDLLAILLGTGTEGESAIAVAASLLASAGGLIGLARVSAHVLAARRGVGPAKASRITAAIELGKRIARRQLETAPATIGSLAAVADWARPRLAALEHEEVWLLALDGRNGLKSAKKIAQGGLHGCALTPRDVLQPALREGASAIVLVHNHPSGDAGPSPEDVQMTRAVQSACEVVGVPLLDHVVVARGGASSLFELGVLG